MNPMLHQRQRQQRQVLLNKNGMHVVKGRVTGLFYGCLVQRTLILVAMALPLSGCGLLSPGTQAISQSALTIVNSRRAAPLDTEYVRKTGSGVLQAAFDDAPYVYLGLHQIDPRSYILDFKSQDHRVVQLYNGQLRGTLGWPRDIVDITPLGADPFFDGFRAIHPSQTIFWAIDAPGVGVRLIAEARYADAGREMVDTLYGRWDLRRITETWSVADLEFSRTNTYWIDADGIVVRSVQQPLPSLPEMDLTLYSYGVTKQ